MCFLVKVPSKWQTICRFDSFIKYLLPGKEKQNKKKMTCTKNKHFITEKTHYPFKLYIKLQEERKTNRQFNFILLPTWTLPVTNAINWWLRNKVIRANVNRDFSIAFIFSVGSLYELRIYMFYKAVFIFNINAKNHNFFKSYLFFVSFFFC